MRLRAKCFIMHFRSAPPERDQPRVTAKCMGTVMNDHHVDAVAKTLFAAASRRRTLGGLLGGAFALFGLSNSDESLAATGRCKPTCKACETCQKGKCRRTPRGKKCKKGKCKPKPNGTRCGADRICDRGVCRLRCGAGGVCLVFVTSTEHNGKLGGLDGADDICQRLAAAKRLPGTYKAWLSDDTISPAVRFTNRDATGPYELVNGSRIANNWADLTDGAISAPINQTEDGTSVDNYVWTNTLPDGTRGGLFPTDDCENWTSDSDAPEQGGNGGRSTQTGAEWTSSTHTGSLCVSRNRLYCFQQG
jgi:hypothetical protein